MIILDQLPFFRYDTQAVLSDGTRVAVRKFQIVAWISLAPKGMTHLPADARRFPAILDTGHNHNVSTQHDHFTRCFVTRDGVGLAELPFPLTINDRDVPRYDANVWLHPNQRGQRDLFTGTQPVCLQLADGVAIFPAGRGGPRLPLLGLRALATNRLVLTVDGIRLRASLKSKPS